MQPLIVFVLHVLLPFLSSLLTPCILIQATLFTATSSVSLFSSLTLLRHNHSNHFLSYFTFASSLVLSSHTSFSHLAHSTTCSLHLTPLENEHQEQAPKGWRARELPQGLVLSFDLTMLRGCPGWKRLNIVTANAFYDLMKIWQLQIKMYRFLSCFLLYFFAELTSENQKTQNITENISENKYPQSTLKISMVFILKYICNMIL